MALIKCYECGKEISDKAISCPNCGAPTNLDSNKNQGLRKEESLLEKNIKEEKEKVIDNVFIEKESKSKENKISFKDNKTSQFIRKYIFGYGRISRKQYLRLNAVILSPIILILIVMGTKTVILSGGQMDWTMLVPIAVFPLFFLPLVRLRFHDIGASFGRFLIYMIIVAIYGWLVTNLPGFSDSVISYPFAIAAFYCIIAIYTYLTSKGEQGKNKYGDNPDDKYIGDYVNGKKNGIGIYIFADGERYEGEFKDDMFHGNGTYYYLDGTKKEGVFENDELIK